MADYGVRKYDSFTGRFMTADVLFEKYHAWNPYHYSVNNPITYRDGNGYDIVYSVNDTEVARIIKDGDHEYRQYDDSRIKISENFESKKINFDEIAQNLEKDAVAYGFSLTAEFAFGGGGSISLQFINFIKGEDKDNGTFRYLTTAGRIGMSAGPSAEFFTATSSLEESQIDRYTPEGSFAGIDLGIGIASKSLGFSFMSSNIFSLFTPGRVRYFDTKGIGSPGSVGISVGIGQTQCQNCGEAKEID